MRTLRVCSLLLLLGICVSACADGDARGAGRSHTHGEAVVNAVASDRTVPISTSSWRPGDAGRDALISGVLSFTPDGCPQLGSARGVVWPAGFTSVVRANGDQVIVTADGREIAAGDTVTAGGAAVTTDAPEGMPCIAPGTTLTYIESEVQIVRGG